MITTDFAPPETRPETFRPARVESNHEAVALLIQGDDDYGVGRVAREIVRHVPGLRVVAFVAGSETDDIAAAGVPVHVLPGGDYFRGFSPRSGFLGAVRQLARARPHWERCARELDRWSRAHGVRVLHGNVFAHYFALTALRRLRPGRYRTIWHLHNFLNTRRHLGVPARFNWWQARRGADCLLAVSRAVAGGWGGSGVPVEVIHNCVPSERTELCTRPVRSSTACEAGVRLMTAGRLEWCKGHHVAIAAVAHLRELGVAATLDVFGGPLAGNAYFERQLQPLVAALDLEHAVTFLGFASDLPERLHAYDLALHCRVDPEPCSIFVLECMSVGVPLVASANGGTPELLRDGREGGLYRAGDAKALAERVAALVQRPDAGRPLGRAARDRARDEFAPEHFGRRLRALYGRLQRPGPVPAVAWSANPEAAA